MLDDITKKELKERAIRLKNGIERVNRTFDKGDIVAFVRDAENKVVNCIEKDSILREIEYRLKLIDS